LEANPLVVIALVFNDFNSIVAACRILRHSEPDIDVGGWVVLIGMEIACKL
jgi:hypothetical protein